MKLDRRGTTLCGHAKHVLKVCTREEAAAVLGVLIYQVVDSTLNIYTTTLQIDGESYEINRILLFYNY